LPGYSVDAMVQNLINNGILPICFKYEKDYDDIMLNDELIIDDTLNQINEKIIIVKNITKNKKYELVLDITERQKKMLISGGLLNLIKNITNL